MQHTFFVLLAAWLPLANAASACDTLDASVSPLEIRRPVRGEDVRFIAGFGIRNHPILNYPKMHTGVDWQAKSGTRVIAAGRGRVVSADREGEYGNRVIISHGGPWQTLYAHLASFAVREGDCVQTGTVIGVVGATGLVNGPILHFEVHRDSQPVDPMTLPIRPQGSAIEGKQ